jgi:hypothetical protein
MCERTRLCERCFASLRRPLTEAARSLGEAWAIGLDNLGHGGRPWADDATLAPIARKRMSTLTVDPRMLGDLAREFARSASEWWYARYPHTRPMSERLRRDRHGHGRH